MFKLKKKKIVASFYDFTLSFCDFIFFYFALVLLSFVVLYSSNSSSSSYNSFCSYCVVGVLPVVNLSLAKPSSGTSSDLMICCCCSRWSLIPFDCSLSSILTKKPYRITEKLKQLG